MASLHEISRLEATMVNAFSCSYQRRSKLLLKVTRWACVRVFRSPYNYLKISRPSEVYGALSYQLGRYGTSKIYLSSASPSLCERNKNYLGSGVHVLEHKPVRKQLCDTSAPEFRLKFLA